MANIVVYGAYGYTGELIVREAKKQGVSLILSGRDEKKLKVLSQETGFAYTAVDLNNNQALHNLLQNAQVVIHCAGPFQFTAKAMVEACLKTQTHYLDITGEYQVFELIHSYHDAAKRVGIMLLPGAGFDVVPSDCLASHLKAQLPNAQKLQLAFATTGGGLSRGTSKTMIEGAGEGQVYRSNHQLKTKPLGKSTPLIDYGPFKKLSVGISWGDISSAYFSTGIPNIEVFTGSSEKQIKALRWSHRLGFLLKVKWVKALLKKQVDKKPAGPTAEKRGKSNTYLWGKVESTNGKTYEARLKTPNGYTLTAKATLLFANKILNKDFKAGFQTPALVYGSNVIFEIEGCKFENRASH
ncbi:saccharopine dehydrogenase NADP-binding domain-containing protein [Fulvivirga sp. 29W222]|uniref:Saccharopine dehydrogenase NADP-binding domain-containing protein n=1 Tax=Fulvivirga marina TaxID=2494733 RepID=A0A937FWY9_9BACT|nr:saccharopine dehydrogenase NADP-binding domain-containing protein [Fulvivirga marina]MBL6446048.1 saccharopine dehydrogenase NADP-binding domain-containing protein [Fulvivirga marina]